METPIDRSFNVAVLQIASKIFPTGYDISETAPDSYNDLKAHLDGGNRMVVYSGGSENTVYGCPEVNWAWRAWHDYCHLAGEHPFTLEGEYGTYRMQVAHLKALYDDTPRVQRWANLLFAEVMGQNLYFHRHRKFPENQRAFVLGFLENPEAALTL